MGRRPDLRTKILLVGLGVLCCTAIPDVCNAQFQAQPPRQNAPASTRIDTVLLNKLLNASPPEIRFRRDDVIAVSVYGLPGFSGEQRVEPDGTIRYPFIGTVKVAGMTTPELEEELESALKSAEILPQPHVTVSTVAAPWNVVTVSGLVEKPGVFPAYGNLTLSDYLSEAGGLVENLIGASVPTNSSASSIVTLVRPSLGGAVSIPLGPDPANSPYADIQLFAGDEVRVGRVGNVYAVGAFRFQGAYPLKGSGPTTVLQLMAMAGGIGFEGIRSEAHIIRANGDSHVILDINVDKMLKGKTADYALQPDDILFVPTAELKAALKGGGAGALVSITDGLLLYNR